MTTVYRDCTLTVSAMSSKKSNDGFLTYEPEGGGAENWQCVRVNCLLELPWMDMQATLERFDEKREESLFDLEEKAPLALLFEDGHCKKTFCRHDTYITEPT